MPPRLLVVDGDVALNLALCAHFEDRGLVAATGQVRDPPPPVWPRPPRAIFDVALLRSIDRIDVSLLCSFSRTRPDLPVIRSDRFHRAITQSRLLRTLVGESQALLEIGDPGPGSAQRYRVLITGERHRQG